MIILTLRVNNGRRLRRTSWLMAGSLYLNQTEHGFYVVKDLGGGVERVQLICCLGTPKRWVWEKDVPLSHIVYVHLSSWHLALRPGYYCTCNTYLPGRSIGMYMYMYK